MNRRRFFPSALFAVFLLVFAQTAAAQATGPLPSWNDGPARQAIIEFVEKATKEGGPEFIPLSERIATFDNDGTLWAEKPLYFQLYFVLDRIRELAPQHPEWTTREPFASILKGDLKTAFKDGEEAILEVALAAEAGMTEEQYKDIVAKWIAAARHPGTKRLFTQMVYQPMLELLAYLRANGFTTYIVSGGGMAFMRPWTEEVYGVLPEQVVGSELETEFTIKDGKPVIMRLPKIAFIDDKAGKPVGINRRIGGKPVAAFGNSDGDIQMLQYADYGKGPRLALLVRHTDAEREYAYDKGAEQALALARENGWTVVDMKTDWKAVYPPEE